MMTLLSSLISFLMGGLPKLMDIFQARQDQAHEREMAKLQMDRELALAAQGFAAQARIEEMRTDQVAMQTAVQEREALYNHDIAIGQGASQWVVDARAFTRSFITYGMFILFAFVEFFGFFFAYHRDVPFDQALDILWDDETQIVWVSIVSFWFGTQAFKK
jgi:hypothetical protein